MDVATYSDLFELVDVNFNKGIERLENFSSFLNDHSGVLLVQDFAIALMLHKLDTEFWCYVLDGIEARPSIGILNENRPNIYFNFGLFVNNSLRKELLLMFLQSDLVLFASITILWLHLAYFLKGKNGVFHLSECYIGLALPIVTFDISLI